MKVKYLQAATPRHDELTKNNPLIERIEKAVSVIPRSELVKELRTETDALARYYLFCRIAEELFDEQYLTLRKLLAEEKHEHLIRRFVVDLLRESPWWHSTNPDPNLVREYRERFDLAEHVAVYGATEHTRFYTLLAIMDLYDGFFRGGIDVPTVAPPHIEWYVELFRSRMFEDPSNYVRAELACLVAHHGSYKYEGFDDKIYEFAIQWIAHSGLTHTDPQSYPLKFSGELGKPKKIKNYFGERQVLAYSPSTANNDENRVR